MLIPASADPDMNTLPRVQRKAMWHEKGGLVVSLNNCSFPVVTGRPSRRHPAFFPDEEIWKAFYANNAVFIGPIFGRLDITNAQILDEIVQVGPAAFALQPSIVDAWSRLENALLDVADYSYATHPDKVHIPPITWPRSPHEYGYRRSHKTRSQAATCATRSREAFHSLCAVVTFILSLWTKEDGLEGRPFSSAFWGLTNRSYAPVLNSWLDRFVQTFVCNISLGIRPGCFIDPCYSVWGPWLEHFVRVGVQVWIVWGNNTTPELCKSKIRCSSYQKFLPPIELVKKVQSEALRDFASRSEQPWMLNANVSTNDGLASIPSHSDSTLHMPPDAPTEPPQPHPNSRQRRGETLVDFLSRVEAGRKKRLESESSSEKQSRESREVHAARSGYSNTCTVFIWEETQGYHLRVKVDRSEVPNIWHDYPASRRVFHSHINEWDLCPPIPPFSDQLTEKDYAEMQQYDEELNAADNAPSLKIPSDRYAEKHSGQMDEAGPTSSFNTASLVFDLVDYLRDRHGYDVHRRPSWTPRLHGTPTVDSVEAAKRFILFESATHPVSVAESIENFCNVLRNENLRVHNLPQSWDLGVIQLDRPGFRLSIGRGKDNKERYIIASTTGEASWVICLHDSTTVLQIFRNRWATLETIVSELLTRGIAFNTGLQHPNPSPAVESSHQSKGLGIRPPSYVPRSDDYNSYVAARTELLYSRLGRAAALMGGLVARLARDTVSALDVLSGPSLFSHLPQVAAIGPLKFVDDHLSEYHLDIISGVYYVELPSGGATHEHLSWWPKHLVWCTSGFYSEQWSADAERWYQERLLSIQRGTATLYNSSQWRSELRRYRTNTRSLRDGINRLTRDAISRQIRYVSA